MIIKSSFKPAWWLANPHVQTIYPTLVNHAKAPIDSNERIELPDGDFIDLAWAQNGLSPESPLVVLLHGLGGGVHSPYVPGLLRAFNKIGFRGVLMHFRGASEEPNRLPKAYHSGETHDLHYIIEFLAEREPQTKKAIIGISLGGNVLLKWLGEIEKQSLIQAAVAVSVPFQLEVVANKVNRGFSRLYQASILRKLRAVMLNKLMLNNGYYPFTAEDLQSLKTFLEFDERITAPLHGFQNAHNYYEIASSRQYLRKIATRTLIIHALDDPFMTPKVIPRTHECSKYVTLELSKHGGHVGFIASKGLGRVEYWLEERIPEFLIESFQNIQDHI